MVDLRDILWDAHLTVSVAVSELAEGDMEMVRVLLDGAHVFLKRLPDVVYSTKCAIAKSKVSVINRMTAKPAEPEEIDRKVSELSDYLTALDRKIRRQYDIKVNAALLA